jgi:small GTP-binding protein
MMQEDRLSEDPKIDTSRFPTESETISPVLNFQYTIRGHTGPYYKTTLSPDGQFLAMPSNNGIIQILDLKSKKIFRTYLHPSHIASISWSPDGRNLAIAGGINDRKVYVYNVSAGKIHRFLGEHHNAISDLVWSPKGDIIASCSHGRTIRLWDSNGQGQKHFLDSSDAFQCLVWSPDGNCICAGLANHSLLVWNINTDTPFESVLILYGHNDQIRDIVWSSDGQDIISCSSDRTIRVWNYKTGAQKYVLEGHTAEVISLSLLDNGQFLASLSLDGMLIIWRTDSWAEIHRIDKIGETNRRSGIVAHPDLPIIVTPGPTEKEITVFEIDFNLLHSNKIVTPTTYYVNAKVVLLGDSGVGKTGLGISIAEGKFRAPEGSTHGAQFWHFSTERLTNLPPNIQAELTLWDLAGQPEYRLTHQLFLTDSDAALLLFDCSDSHDPFHGVRYWAKVLLKHTTKRVKKYLVSSRSDVSPITVDRPEINKILAEYKLDDYFNTSAKTRYGVDQLFQHLVKEISWEQLPRTSTPQLFHTVREFLLECRTNEKTIISMDEIRCTIRQRYNERLLGKNDLDTVIQLLQSSGLVYRLSPRPGTAWVLLKPELINQYSSSIIHSARNHPQGIGAVLERDVLTGNLNFSGFSRLPQIEETLVLEATVELLISHDLCFREMGYLVFPSQINITRSQPDTNHPRTEVTYIFSGAIETIYASLVVRLIYTDYFHREDQWRYTVEFSRAGNRLGFSMRQEEEGTGVLEIFFSPEINEFDRITFIRFITDHLKTKGINIQEQIRLYCPKCSKEVIDREAIDKRIKEGHLDIPCQYCSSVIMIPNSIEECYLRSPILEEKQQQLAKKVKKRANTELKQFRTYQRQSNKEKDSGICILHLSDLHLDDDTQAKIYCTQLETDLIQELNILYLDYLVISGDLVNHASESEYHAAFLMIDSLVKRFGLDPSRVVIVPGNHDVNWDVSEIAYKFVPKRKLPTQLSENRYIPAGDTGALLLDEELYKTRFANFNTYLYRRVYATKEYPLENIDQIVFVENLEQKILFLGLNSSWQIDHYFRDRISINMEALAHALDRLQEKDYKGWLKIAVWHHPITGNSSMNDEFMQLLASHNFQVCLHGHIHEAIEGYHKYDDRRGIRIIGAGTFGASASSQVPGVPLQYNLLIFNPNNSEITVKTRKKVKANGAWSGDALWGDKNKPKTSYSFPVKNYISNKIL